MPSPQVSSGSDVDERDGFVDATALVHRGLLDARAGAIGAALQDLARAEQTPEGVLDDAQRAALLAAILDCRLARGELAEARIVGDRLGAYREDPGLAGATCHHGLAELYAAGDDMEVAAAHLARIPGLLDASTDVPDSIPWRTSAALAAVRLGHRAEGTALAREHLALAGATGAAYPIALGLRTLATVDAHTDRGSLLREALVELDGVVAARLRAQIETDLAGLLVLGGGRGDAAEGLTLLRGAESYAGSESLWPLLGRVRRLLGRMGEEPRPVIGESLASLTAAEQRVARLAATGMTNRQVADQLVVTVKAVEWHLSHVYRKLGISSRSALSTALGPAT